MKRIVASILPLILIPLATLMPVQSASASPKIQPNTIRSMAYVLATVECERMQWVEFPNRFSTRLRLYDCIIPTAPTVCHAGRPIWPKNVGSCTVSFNLNVRIKYEGILTSRECTMYFRFIRRDSGVTKNIVRPRRKCRNAGQYVALPVRRPA